MIGVLEEKGYSFQDQDDRILCPFTTVQERMMGITYINSISLTTVSSGVMSQAETDITNLLRTRHRLAADAENDFSISNSQDILETMEHRRHFPDRRRHRHHEYHARLRDGADKRDRDP